MDICVPNDRPLRESMLLLYILKKRTAEKPHLLVQTFGEHAFFYV